MFEDFLMILIPVSVVIDPAGSLPIFLAMTDGQSLAARRLIARRATVAACLVGISFIIVGQAVLTFLGVKVADFQIAGGVLLVVLSILDLLSAGKPAIGLSNPTDHSMMSLVPLAVPLIIGPATMTTTLLLVSTYTPRYGVALAGAMVSLALVLNLLVLFISMWYSDWVVRLVGRQAMGVINKIVMILLAGIAVSLIRQGIVSIVTEFIKTRP